MHRPKPHTTRNKIDLDDPSQVRCLKKRLGISVDDLQHAVGKVGNSIAAVSKESAGPISKGQRKLGVIVAAQCPSVHMKTILESELL